MGSCYRAEQLQKPFSVLQEVTERKQASKQAHLRLSEKKNKSKGSVLASEWNREDATADVEDVVLCRSAHSEVRGILKLNTKNV